MQTEVNIGTGAIVSLGARAVKDDLLNRRIVSQNAGSFFNSDSGLPWR
jgi:hypothetical protein